MVKKEPGPSSLLDCVKPSMIPTRFEAKQKSKKKFSQMLGTVYLMKCAYFYNKLRLIT